VSARPDEARSTAIKADTMIDGLVMETPRNDFTIVGKS
jgi:hypothetical protein